jgi:hypothetical protein
MPSSVSLDFCKRVVRLRSKSRIGAPTIFVVVVPSPFTRASITVPEAMSISAEGAVSVTA